MKMKKITAANLRTIIAIAVNLIIIVLEITGLVIEAKNLGSGLFVYYTEDSNILCLIASTIYVVCEVVSLVRKNEIPQWVQVFKFVAVSVVAVTLVVVVTVLAPMVTFYYDGASIGEGYYIMMLSGSMLYHHFLCPAIAILSFVLLETRPKMTFKLTLFAMIPTILYAIVSMSLNIARVWVGPYPFLMVYQQPWYMSIVWFIAIDGGAYLLACLIWLANAKMGKIYDKIECKRCLETVDSATDTNE